MESNMNIKTEILTITPAMAKKLLECNVNNRPLSRGTVDRYAKTMASGQWDFNGEPIIFTNENALASGQHRLHACLQSGASFTTLIVRGVKPESFSTIDTGKSRGAADVLAIAGFKNNTSLASGAKTFLWGMDKRDVTRLSNNEILEIVNEFPSLVYWATKFSSQKPRLMTTGIIGVCALIEVFHSREQAQLFFTKAVAGQMLGPKDPEYLLRQSFLGVKTGRSLQGGYKMALMIKAANLSVQKKQISSLRIVEGEKVIFYKGKS
jgi:hypothetical protein